MSLSNYPFKQFMISPDERQRQYNAAMAGITIRSLSGEITPEEAKAEIARITREQFPEFLTKPKAPELERDDPWLDLGPQWGYRRSSSPAAQKATKYNVAYGIRLSDKDIDRFWKKIDVRTPNECWEWINSTRGSLGYGQFRIGDRICDAHRVALELGHGPMKEGHYVCHKCDNPKCCNPHHLFGGTQQENMTDMSKKKRWRNQT